MELDKLESSEKKILASAFAAFRKTDVYEYWKSVVEGQINGRIQAIMQPVVDSNAIYEQEYKKGEIQGLQSALSLFTMLEETILSELPAPAEDEQDEQ